MSILPDPPAWDSILYDQKHRFVARFGEDMLSLLAPQAGERILDLGCGTGHLTQEIAAKGALVIGIDSALSMIEQARKNYPDLDFRVANGENFRLDAPVDAVFSNAALHWMTNAEAVVESMRRALKSGGRLVAEMGGRGNIDLLYGGLLDALKSLDLPLPAQSPWYFPSLGEYTSLLERVGFRIIYAAHFDRPTPLEGEDGLRNWCMMFAGHVLQPLSEDARRRVIAAAEQRLRPLLFHDGVWTADYVRLRIIALRTK